MRVKKAVIPAAGLGTRFLPATKAMAKEMLPIVDKPTIQFIVEEALKSGIEDILIVTGKAKRPIEDHFDANIELEMNLQEKGKTDLLKLVEETTDVNLHFIRQSHPKGLGHAVLQARAFVGNEPFVVMLGDDLMEDRCAVDETIDRTITNTTHASTIAVMRRSCKKKRQNMGLLILAMQVAKGLFNVKNFVEKPAPDRSTK
ncbi:MAG: UTP--glucose-1-phosphate uridylyltransferase [Enterococcus gallinarum]